MREIFIIYDRNTGEIQYAARIDKDLDQKKPDGSTPSEQIAKILANNPEYDVLYLPDQVIPDITEHKIESGRILRKTTVEIDQDKQKIIYEDLIQQEMRRLAIISLQNQGLLPPGYT